MGIGWATKLLAGVLAAGLTAGDGPMEVELESAWGGAARLSALRGRPVILFYEDRDSVGLNQGLKDELFRRGQEKKLLEAVRVVGIANLKPFNFFPARPIALGFVRDAQTKAGIPLWVDWTGAMSAAPWGLPGNSSSVVLLDGRGVVVFSGSGKLGDAQRDAFFQVLEETLAQ